MSRGLTDAKIELRNKRKSSFSLIDGDSSHVGWLEPQGQSGIRVVAEAAVASVLYLWGHIMGSHLLISLSLGEDRCLVLTNKLGIEMIMSTSGSVCLRFGVRPSLSLCHNSQ